MTLYLSVTEYYFTQCSPLMPKVTNLTSCGSLIP